MVVSSGCSNTVSVPRLGNPCEVVMLKLTKTVPIKWKNRFGKFFERSNIIKNL